MKHQKKKKKKKNEEFIKRSLALRDEELKAENNIAQQKTKKIIKDIIDPAPGLLINDTFNQQKDTNIDTQKNTDNTYKLKPDVQKQLSDTILKIFAPPPITQPIPPPPYQNIDQEQLPPTEDIFIDDELNSFVFADDEMSDEPKISLKPEETGNYNVQILSSDEEVNISKSLKDTDIDFTSTPATTVRISTKPNKKKERKIGFRKKLDTILTI